MASLKVCSLAGILLAIFFCCEIKGRIIEDIADLRMDIFDFQSSIGEKNPSKENLTEIIHSLSSFLVPLLKELESSAKLQQKFTSDLDELSSQINDTSCSLSKRLIELENEISSLKGVPDQMAMRTDQAKGFAFRKTIAEEDFFITPNQDYVSTRRYCYEHQGTPFIPKTQGDVELIVRKTIRSSGDFGWIPLTDIIEEGVGEWNDGTQYDAGLLRLSFTDDDVNNGNSQPFDCVDINSDGLADWYRCDVPRRMLCVRLNNDRI